MAEKLKLSERVERLEDLMTTLAKAQIRTEEQLAQFSAETKARFRETDERMARLAEEDRERGRKLDERIEKLVSAIGELVRRDSEKSM
ncbi:MAG: hypothetical protein ACLQU1_02220 [Bryobacteraceae bacterium]